ncbi:uncharacterized protein [Antedon mediterranea]|uniref:uncharacterized protein isoform X1 n=1 Tax=Antedon mediterranea TaxID=105859 RepID=UPI003AF82086
MLAFNISLCDVVLILNCCFCVGAPRHHSDHNYAMTSTVTPSTQDRTEDECQVPNIPIPLNETPARQSCPSTSRHASTLKYRVRVCRLKAKMKKIQSTIIELAGGDQIESIVQKAKTYMSTNALDFFAGQLRIGKKKPKGHRYTVKDRLFSIALHFQGPRAYRFCRKMFVLPHPRSLKRWLQRVEVKPGFNDATFSSLKIRCATFNERERVVAVSLDEMSLKAAIKYNRYKDCMEGLEDYGSIGTTKKVATQALMFMVRSMTSRWKQFTYVNLRIFYAVKFFNRDIISDKTKSKKLIKVSHL